MELTKNNRKKYQSYIIIIVAVIAVTLFILSTIFNHDLLPDIFSGKYSQLLNHQMVMIGSALFILFLTTVIFEKESLKLLSFKNRDGEITPVKLLGIKPKANETWKHLGLQMSVTITLITSVVIYFQVVKGHPFKFQPSMLIVLLLAASNAFSEEIIYRFSLVAAGQKLKFPHGVSEISSAVIFGLAHYFGNPGGIPGVLMAAFIGWFLAKSMNETRGFFWAYLIHFLQDVVIFYAIILSFQ